LLRGAHGDEEIPGQEGHDADTGIRNWWQTKRTTRDRPKIITRSVRMGIVTASQRIMVKLRAAAPQGRKKVLSFTRLAGGMFGNSRPQQGGGRKSRIIKQTMKTIHEFYQEQPSRSR